MVHVANPMNFGDVVKFHSLPPLQPILFRFNGTRIEPCQPPVSYPMDTASFTGQGSCNSRTVQSPHTVRPTPSIARPTVISTMRLAYRCGSVITTPAGAAAFAYLVNG